MNIRGKKYRKAIESVAAFDTGTLKGAFEALIKGAWAGFDESVTIDMVLGIDPTRGGQTVRGSVLLPNGTGKKVRVLAFAKGEHVDAARAAGADVVGNDDLVEKILGGWLEFDIAVATPDAMGIVGKVARILGPRGMLPSNKVGTVSFDLAPIIKDLKRGRVYFRNDKGGGLHALIGKKSFGAEKLEETLRSLLAAVRSCKPASSKGKFFKKVVVSSTMGMGIPLNVEES